MKDLVYDERLVKEIGSIITEARKNVVQQVNNELLMAYWNIGRVIVEDELKKGRGEYGKEQMIELSKTLTNQYGKGFSRQNLYRMKLFYQKYPNFSSVTRNLSWTHYCELLYISDDNKRSFYEKEVINSNWSVREMKRQINTSLYERLLLSNGKANKQKVLELARNGNELNKPEDIIKDPYVFEFLGLPDNKPIMESDLEKALVDHLERFLLELGKGFMFVGTQQRITLFNNHYYVDAVFYNKILRCYVLIELKTTKFLSEAVGQLNMYLNYYKSEINDENDNDPIGIILCTDKRNIEVEFALGGLSNHIFASEYTYYIPNKEELIAEIESVIEEMGM